MDDRFDLTVKFRIYDEEFEWNANLNWTAYHPDDIDHRIIEWFKTAHDEAYEKYRQKTYALEKEYRESVEKARELAELKRLQEKYPDAIKDQASAQNFTEKVAETPKLKA